MDSGNGGGGDDGVHGGSGDLYHNSSTHFNRIPIHSNFFNPSSFSKPPNPNPNPNSIYDLNPLNPLNSVQNSNPGYDPGTQTDPNPNKNPKKRTRASRRAPTTVMTTDTTNFRRMVQQYTGIPDSPFATSSPAGGFTRRSDILRPAASYLNSGSNLHSESYNIIKPHPNLSNLNNINNMFSLQSFPPLQVNVTEVTGVMGNSDPFVGSSSMKRWRGHDENFVNFEGRSGISQNVVVSNVSVRNDDDEDNDDGRLPGNEDSWICPSD
ncbi:uncharacterized protein LOC143616767 [Bidens hawaiensis]|uniref:uncharacterized protein LOC143616767 n=1 Tax=Bidens hawaiensis TaxID=980011 RepID=UPI00404A97F5